RVGAESHDRRIIAAQVEQRGGHENDCQRNDADHTGDPQFAVADLRRPKPALRAINGFPHAPLAMQRVDRTRLYESRTSGNPFAKLLAPKHLAPNRPKKHGPTRRFAMERVAELVE